MLELPVAILLQLAPLQDEFRPLIAQARSELDAARAREGPSGRQADCR